MGANTMAAQRLSPGEELRLALTVSEREPGQYPIPIAGIAWETEHGEVVRTRPEPPVLTVVSPPAPAGSRRQTTRPTVFVSYRSVDTAQVLTAALAELDDAAHAVFSTRDIRAADHWRAVLHQELRQAAALVALIGPRWLGASTASGRRLLDIEHDWVRLEIATALARGIPVLPLLVDGAAVPDPDDLPSDIAGLADHQGLAWRPGSGELLRAVRRLTA